MATSYYFVTESQIFKAVPTKKCSETQGNETCYLKLTGISRPKRSANSLTWAAERGVSRSFGQVPRICLHASHSCFTNVCCNGEGKQAFLKGPDHHESC